jgi:hypothetical protein
MTGMRAERAGEHTSALGEVTALARDDVAIVYLDVAADVESIQGGWPTFESRFSSLRGRVMMAAVYPERGIYRLATLMRNEDDPDALGLSMGVLPGGACLRLVLAGDPPVVHGRIGRAFETLRGLGEPDPSRPCLEIYASPTRVECYLPVQTRT